MSEVTMDFIRKEVARGKKYTLVFLKVGPHRNQDDKTGEEIQAAHLLHIFKLKKSGMLLVNGPLLDHPEIKGVGIYNSTNKEEVLALAKKDPAVIAGRLVPEIFEWFGIPGSALV